MKTEKLPVVKKAYKIKNYLADDGDYYRTVYAETEGKAKSAAKSEYSYDEYDFKHIKAERLHSEDVVLFEGVELLRRDIDILLHQRERNKTLLELPDDELYYVQDSRSYCGNSVFWWGKNSAGYTTDLTKAHKFTKEEIVKKFTNGRETDIIWLASHVEQHIKVHVDAQYLQREFCY